MRHLVVNFAWLGSGRFLQVASAAVIGVLIARHLGPSDFGLLSYVMAIVGIAMVLVPLGLPSVLTRRMVADPGAEPVLLATATAMQGLAALAVYAAVLVLASFLEEGGQSLLPYLALYGLILLAKPATAYRMWFEAHVLSKHLVRMELVVLAVASLAKLTALAAGADLWTFLIIQVLGASAESLGAAYMYRRVTRRSTPLAWERSQAHSLFAESWPLIFSAIGLVVYLKVDQVMLGLLADTREVGVYAAAQRLSEVWYILPVILISTIYPALIRAREASREAYDALVASILQGLIGVALLISLAMSLLATPIVVLIFGPAYAEAGPVLALHAWAAVFVFIGVLTGKWYLLEGVQKLSIARNMLGAVLNVVLNFWAIPAYGAWGAALATLISYAAVNLFADVFWAATRPLLRQKLAAFVLWPRVFLWPGLARRQLSEWATQR